MSVTPHLEENIENRTIILISDDSDEDHHNASIYLKMIYLFFGC